MMLVQYALECYDVPQNHAKNFIILRRGKETHTSCSISVTSAARAAKRSYKPQTPFVLT